MKTKQTLLSLSAAFCSILTLNSQIDLVRLGTDYGGWTIPQNLLKENSICYLAGAGEDISFDLSLIIKYGCRVYTFDPTPRAIGHFEYIKTELESGRIPCTRAGSNPSYNCGLVHLNSLKFFPYGLWKENTLMKFYSPRTPTHVSHSILNLQKTNNYFEAECKRLSTIMKELGHDHIDLLKLDIEGAEYAVIESIIEDNLDVKCICLEFDEFAGVNYACNTQREESRQRVLRCIKSLLDFGYEIVYMKDFTDMTFLKVKH